MPNIAWTCAICGEIHDTWTEAKACEASHGG